MKWIPYTAMLALGLLVISCSGPGRTSTDTPSILPPVVMSTTETDASTCSKRCAVTTDACMTSCTSGPEEAACAKAAMRCMNGCQPRDVL